MRTTSARRSLTLIIAFFGHANARPSPIAVAIKARASVPASNIDRLLQWNRPSVVWKLSGRNPASKLQGYIRYRVAMVIIPGTSCGSTCAGQTAFDGTKSSIFTDLNTPQTVRFGTGGGVQPADGNLAMNLNLVQDKLTFFGLDAGLTQFYIILNKTGPVVTNPPWHGIVGMTNQWDGSVFQNLVNAGLPGLFGLYLAPKSVNNGAGELMLGGINANHYSGNLTYFPLAFPDKRLWELNSTGLSVNGQTSTILSTAQTWVFDSGTSNIVLPKNLTEVSAKDSCMRNYIGETTFQRLFNSLISPDIKPVGTLGAYGIACSKISSLTANIDLAFVGSDRIPSSELNVGKFNTSDTSSTALCQTLINANDQLLVAGASLLKHWYSVWDQANARMGFAPAK
ncbi:hypothetical protein FRC12_010501 [Ceratobasidium sp. 428]|nr:hypothetical protein FRC12_010501 [Ceratobasidium sp. 428]